MIKTNNSLLPNVIPDDVIRNWMACYEIGSNLRMSYPDLDWERIVATFGNDKNSLADYLFWGALPQDRPKYIATAGAPGSGKSTLLDLKTKELNGVFIDPDRYTMSAMTAYRLYLLSAGMIATDGNEEASRRAYNVCRGASNALSLEWLNQCVRSRLNIKHGTTLSGKPSRYLLEGLKKHGYRIEILVSLASRDTILDCLEHRKTCQAFYQSTPEDEVKKDGDFYDRLPMYFELGDIVEVYYKPSLMELPVKVAHCINKRSWELIAPNGSACQEANALIASHHPGLNLMDLMLGKGKER
jgi:predicted ABC-type ATPase